jgi:hypothetical protein
MGLFLRLRLGVCCVAARVRRAVGLRDFAGWVGLRTAVVLVAFFFTAVRFAMMF